MAVRTYAQILGVVLLLIGVLGLVLGERLFLGILNIDILEDVVHLLTGGLLAYVGFGRVDEGLARTLVGVLGVIGPTRLNYARVVPAVNYTAQLMTQLLGQ